MAPLGSNATRSRAREVPGAGAGCKRAGAKAGGVRAVARVRAAGEPRVSAVYAGVWRNLLASRAAPGAIVPCGSRQAGPGGWASWAPLQPAGSGALVPLRFAARVWRLERSEHAAGTGVPLAPARRRNSLWLEMDDLFPSFSTRIPV